MGIGNELIGDVEELLTRNVISSKGLFRFSTNGNVNYCSVFENEVSKLYHGYHTLMLPSASVGLVAILKALGISGGDEILIPPFSWKANYAALDIMGCLTHFVDIDENLAIKPQAIEEKITPNSKAVIVPHLMGRAQRYIKEIAELCKNKNLLLIEDISQSFGVKLDNKMIGTFGDASYCSLNHHKIISTGDGGFVLIKDKAIFESIMSLHDQGCHISNGKRIIPSPSGFGSSLRVSNIIGAVALAQLTRFFLIKTKVWNCYNKVQSIMKEHCPHKELPLNKGDIPFFYLFKTVDDCKIQLPTLRESGWHSVQNIDSFTDIQKGSLQVNYFYLSQVYSIGAGLIDKYYSTPLGLSINHNDDSIEQLKRKLKETIL